MTKILKRTFIITLGILLISGLQFMKARPGSKKDILFKTLKEWLNMN